jgi:hypothetical protein
MEGIMRRARATPYGPCLVAAAILTLGCGDSNPAAPPATREIEVTVKTTVSGNGPIDPDGYRLNFDQHSVQSVGVNDIVRIAAVSLGTHFVQLDGMASNCSVDGPNPRPVEIAAAYPPTTMIEFTVTCGVPTTPGPWDY